MTLGTSFIFLDFSCGVARECASGMVDGREKEVKSISFLRLVGSVLKSSPILCATKVEGAEILCGPRFRSKLRRYFLSSVKEKGEVERRSLNSNRIH